MSEWFHDAAKWCKEMNAKVSPSGLPVEPVSFIAGEDIPGSPESPVAVYIGKDGKLYQCKPDA